jgi:pimeloyl-ACP methyl ester carboxylesterase
MYKAFTGLGFTAVAVTSMAVAMIQMVQKNPCEMVPLFRASPENFILEFSRWHNRVDVGFTADSNEDSSDPFEPSFHSIRAANLDKSVFPNPLEFDPSRPNLDQVISFNVLEEDFANAEKDSFGRPINHPPVTTLHRVCPSRKFVPRYLEKVLPHFFPEVDGGQCSKGNSVVHGVEYTTEEVRVQSGANGSNKTVFVRKSEIANSKSPYQSGLVIALHGYPFTPVETSSFCSQLRKHPSMKTMSCWAPELPGTAPSDVHGKCTFRDAGSTIAALVRGANSRNKWNKVYLLGDGVGGTIAWSAAKELSKDELEGLIVINAAHPEIMMGGVVKTRPSWKDVPFGPMLMPLVNPIINSAKYLDTKFEDYSWWTTRIRAEYKGRVEDIGPARMACYYTKNFKVESGIVTPEDLPYYRDIDPESHILMITGGAGAPSKVEMEYSIARIKLEKGRLVQLHAIVGAPRAMTLLQEPDDVAAAAERVSQFIRQTRLMKASAWNSYYPPITVTGGFVEDYGYKATIPFCAFFVILLMMFGLALELYLGPSLLLEAFRREQEHEKIIESGNDQSLHFAGHFMGTQATGLHHGAKIVMAPLVIAASASRQWWAGLMFVFGLFHCGFPEVSSTLITAYTGTPFVTTDAKSGGDADADDKMRVGGSNSTHAIAIQHMKERDKQKKEAKLPKRFRIMFLLNGLAYLMHHCGAIIVHTSICAHHVELELVTMTLMANAMQHATCFIQFSYPNVSGCCFCFCLLLSFPFSPFPLCHFDLHRNHRLKQPPTGSTRRFGWLVQSKSSKKAR